MWGAATHNEGDHYVPQIVQTKIEKKNSVVKSQEFWCSPCPTKERFSQEIQLLSILSQGIPASSMVHSYHQAKDITTPSQTWAQLAHLPQHKTGVPAKTRWSHWSLFTPGLSHMAKMCRFPSQTLIDFLVLLQSTRGPWLTENKDLLAHSLEVSAHGQADPLLLHLKRSRHSWARLLTPMLR